VTSGCGQTEDPKDNPFQAVSQRVGTRPMAGAGGGRLVHICVDTQPMCGDFDVDFCGCSTFSDIASAHRYMQKIAPSH
jgi:hypothetical protein